MRLRVVTSPPQTNMKEVTQMKLNKILTQMREANAEGGAVTIYGAKAYHRIYNFKAIKAADVDCNGVITFVLTDNTEITAYYAE